jgi:hypothetical protein
MPPLNRGQPSHFFCLLAVGEADFARVQCFGRYEFQCMPPKNTPAVPPAGAAAPQYPSALFLSAGIVNKLMTIDITVGAMKAAPIPCL